MTRVALLTKEYPPEIYGGAGVHVEHLSRELAKAARCRRVLLRSAPGRPARGGCVRALGLLSAKTAKGRPCGRCRPISAWPPTSRRADLVHSHTWYANFAGYLAHVLYDIPHVMTSHSLEPLRPWKAEQLGAGYRLSSWVERTAIESADAVIAVSRAMRDDVLRVYPAVDPRR